MFKNKTKKLIAFFITIGLFAFFSSVFAQNFGTNEVGVGLGNSLSVADPREIAGRIINILLGLLGVIAVGIIMYGGFVWLTSGGEEEKIRKAQTILKNGVIGLAIILASWAIAAFVINQLSNGINGGGSGGRCSDGDSRSCGCENSGSMYCSGGSWGGCVGASTDCGDENKPKTCDVSPLAGCQATNQICASSDYCDNSSCKCIVKGGAGASCDGDLSNSKCDADNNRCGEYLSCDTNTCLCFGPPVITQISPVGGFCQEDKNKSCTKDSDCSTSCNSTAPNGATNNFLTIFGKGFGVYSSSTSQVLFTTGNEQAIFLNGNQYNSAAVTCEFGGGGITGSCTNASWEYKFNINQAGSYRPWVETSNNTYKNNTYLDLDKLAPDSGGENICTMSGVQHHIVVYIDGTRMGDICNPAIAPTSPKAIGSINNVVLSAGVHTVRLVWDNDWTYNPDGVWGTSDDADSNLIIYRVGFSSMSSSLGVQPKELNPACINTWRDDQVIIAVPSGARTGSIKIINKDGLSDETNNDFGPKIDNFVSNNIVRPGLCSLTPNQGVLSDRVDYQGLNLFSGNAYFGNYQSNVQGIVSNFTNQQGFTGTSYIPNIKAGESGSFVISNLNGNSQLSNSLLFVKDKEVGVGPYIISFWPIEGNAGQYVTIRGNGFGSSKGTSKVFFGDTEASYEFPDVCLNSVWKDNQIIVKVPANLPNDSHVIKIKIGTLTIDSSKIAPSPLSSNTFRSDKNLDLLTSICKIEPNNGPVATPVSLYGENFGPQKSEVLVKFTLATSTTSTVLSEGKADLIKTTVPPLSITGPVKVIKKGFSGNEVNFTVGSCVVNADCGATQVCCPAGTYREGRCFGSLESCSSDVPTSVFEWSFSTSFTNIPTNPYYSCAGMAKALNSCQVGATCPNTPGTCSPYGGGTKVVGKKCDFNCTGFPGCSTPGSCVYDPAINKCVKNTSGGECSRTGTFVYESGGKKVYYQQTCNSDKHWAITSSVSCPANWTRATANHCVDLSSSCVNCDAGLSCETSTTGQNRCVSEDICPSGSICDKNADTSGEAKCVSEGKASCSCCCTIGQDKEDCCSYTTKTGVTGKLTCGGTCGTDTTNDGKGLGSCGGCAAAGDSAEERDAACNCTGHSGQYCDVNDSHPQGVCSDCTSLSDKTNCGAHGAACCFDSNKTETATDDSCRGGSPIADGIDKGYCAYYDCQKESSVPAGDPKLCATSTPVKLGFYASINNCTATSTGCYVNPGTDYCSTFDGNFDKCSLQGKCCFDNDSKKCKGGSQIPLGENKGYCAYYDCQVGNNKLCSPTASITGKYLSTTTCAVKCANEEGGAGMSCENPGSLCAFDSCSLPGLQCLTATGTLGILPDCGSCCCQPGLATDSCNTALTPNLHCQADKGNCSGAGRGLCCGCSTDSECGNSNTTGCGSDSCCEARPQIETVTPPHLAEKVCRNTVIKIAFNQLMDIASASKVVLLEGKKSGLCQAPSTLADASLQELFNNQSESKFAKIYQSINNILKKVVGLFGGKVMADVPDSKMIYCNVPGSVQNLEEGKKTSLVFSPNKLLNPDSQYYIVVLGDENLNSQSGAISLKGIGFNGEGYYNTTTKLYVEGDQLKFNNNIYKNSRISKFTTLGGVNSICKIDHVVTTPSSYLFSTTNNDLNENDVDARADGFDSIADKDKVIAATAYSRDGQALQPVSGYYWDWNWQVENTKVAAISPVINLATNKSFVSAIAGITDDSTKINATVNMSRFQPQSNCVKCECSGINCSNNCCNDYFENDLTKGSSDLFVFVCQNPWPPVAADGTWSPWSDNCQGATGCSNYNYKFYYCRDAGDATTLDDLPAIISDAVIIGQSANTVCSSDHSACTGLNTPCGIDKNGDGVKDGVCLWNVLKESYFFRESSIQGGQIISATDMLTGDSVRVSWRSESAPVFSYKTYYLKNGQGEAISKEISPASACKLSGSLYDCNTVISGLTVDTNYLFKVSAISRNKVESLLLGEIMATTSDRTPPKMPTGLKVNVANSKALFTWNANTDKISSYSLYHGTRSYTYGESFPIASNLTSKELDLGKYSYGNHYFALSSIDGKGYESGKSSQVYVIKNACTSSNGMIMTTFKGTGSRPTALAYDGKNMWSADFAGKSVTKITPQGIMSIYSNIVQNPSSIAYDGKNMWVANLFSNSVSVINSAGVALTYNNIGQQPMGIAYDGKNMWTANYGNSSVSKINPAGKSIVYPIGGNNNPFAIAYDGANMWTSNASNSVTKITSTGKVTTYAGTGSSPVAIVFDGTNMWTANSGDNSVSKISPTGKITTYKNIGSGPRGIAFDGTYIWVANSSGNSVTRVTSSGQAETYEGTGSGPNAIAYDGKNMWTTDYNSSSVTRISKADPNCVYFDFGSGS